MRALPKERVHLDGRMLYQREEYTLMDPCSTRGKSTPGWIHARPEGRVHLDGYMLDQREEYTRWMYEGRVHLVDGYMLYQREE